VKWPAHPSKLKPHFPTYYRNTAHFRREEDYFAPSVFQAATRWVEQNHNQESFFLMIDSFDPHEPWHTPEEFWRIYDPDYEGEHPIWPPYGRPTMLSPEELRHVHALYSGEITMADKWFGRFINRLDQLRLLDNTMIVVTSDHGFLFGEHNWLGKHSDTHRLSSITRISRSRESGFRTWFNCLTSTLQYLRHLEGLLRHRTVRACSLTFWGAAMDRTPALLPALEPSVIRCMRRTASGSMSDARNHPDHFTGIPNHITISSNGRAPRTHPGTGTSKLHGVGSNHSRTGVFPSGT
jgi:hypothetical protein